MIEATGIAITDGLNRKNHFFPTKALLNAYEESWKYGVPSNFNHDSTIFMGWTFLSGIYFEPSKAYMLNKYYQSENDKDMELLREYAASYHYKKYVNDRKNEYEKLRALLGKTLSHEGNIIPTYNAVAFEETDLALKAIPDLSNLLVDGMVSLKDLKVFVPGAYEFGDYIVFAHRYYRRSGSLMNWINRDFLEKIEGMISDSLDIKIALDFDVVALKESVHDEFEYAYWWGPTFNDNVNDIPAGVTRYENTYYDKLFSNIKNTDFYWYNHDGEQTFECEELNCRPINRTNQEYYDCRYVHSRLNGKKIVHLDGAIRSYNEDQMILRMDEKLDQTGHYATYKKLWRVDGEIDIVLWKELITHFYRDNMLVGEYLGGKDTKLEQFVIGDKKDKPKILPAKKYLPNDMKKGNGIRFLYSLKRISKSRRSKNDISTRPLQTISLGQGETFFPIIDAETITLLKLIKKNGGDIRIPFTKRVAYEDMIFNFPILRCKTIEAASIVFFSIEKLLKSLSERREDRLISFTIEVEKCKKDAIVCLSFAGHVDDMVKIFDYVGTNFPISEELNGWLLKVYEYNTSIETVKNKALQPYNLIRDDETLIFERSLVPAEYMDDICFKDGSLYGTIKVPIEDKETINKLHLGIAPAYVIKESKCKKCGRNYILCDCIKFVDDVTEEITEAELVGYYWTCRHSQDLYFHVKSSLT